ncbi:MAG: XdhC family protein [Gammaproteobacteria bacterium]
MNSRELLRRFEEWRAEARPLVLASVYETQGSTYSKAGSQMLITADGDFQGLLSGGCLEGDLAERAARVAGTGVPETVTYDLGGPDDELFGLGVGCDGTMRIFLQPLPRPDYQPFAAVAERLAGDEPGMLATVIRSDSPSVSPGEFALLGERGVERATLSGQVLSEVQAAGMRRLPERASGAEALSADGDDVTVLFAAVMPPPRLLILGAGPDALPLVDIAARLGWRVGVRDHRPVYIETTDFGPAEQASCGPAEELADDVDLDRYSAAMVMSHHLATDRAYLRALAATNIPYVGLLGPPRRREQLLADLGEAAGRLAPRLHGPAGLDIGARGAEGIALSIVSEIYAVLAGDTAAGRSLGAPAA